jgi:hypothetical protein
VSAADDTRVKTTITDTRLRITVTGTTSGFPVVFAGDRVQVYEMTREYGDNRDGSLGCYSVEGKGMQYLSGGFEVGRRPRNVYGFGDSIPPEVRDAFDQAAIDIAEKVRQG